jgi:hypothetical protein
MGMVCERGRLRRHFGNYGGVAFVFADLIRGVVAVAQPRSSPLSSSSIYF